MDADVVKAPERVWTPREVAQYLGVSLSWVRQKFGRRTGVMRFGTRHMRIPDSVLQSFMAECGYAGNPAGTVADFRKITRGSEAHP